MVTRAVGVVGDGHEPLVGQEDIVAALSSTPTSIRRVAKEVVEGGLTHLVGEAVG